MKWKTIPGFSAYEVSDRGDVRRHIKKIIRKPGRRNRPGQLLKPCVLDGRPSFYLLRDDGKLKGLKASQAVALAFIGPPPKGKEKVLHWNDIPTDNRVTNLRWGNSKENHRDAVRNKKLNPKGSGNPAAILNEEIVLKMRRSYTEHPRTLKKMSGEFGVSFGVIWSALVGATWKHVPEICKIQNCQAHRFGEDNPHAKLTWEEVREIRRRYIPRVVTYSQLAAEFGVDMTLIPQIIKYQIWKE